MSIRRPSAPRWVHLSRSGRYALVRQPGGRDAEIRAASEPPGSESLGHPPSDTASAESHLDVVDALGTAPRRRLTFEGLQDFACVGDSAWVAAGGRFHHHRFDGDRVERVERVDAAAVDIDLGDDGAGVLEATADGTACLWRGRATQLLIRARAGRAAAGVGASVGASAAAEPLAAAAGGFETIDIGALADGLRDRSALTDRHTLVSALDRRRLVFADGGDVRVVDVDYDHGHDHGHDHGAGTAGVVVEAPLPLGEVGCERVLDSQWLFGGRALFWLGGGDRRACIFVTRPTGRLVHQVELGALGAWAVAERRGRAVMAGAEPDAPLVCIDLRYGKHLATQTPPLAVGELEIDADAHYLVMAGWRDQPVAEEAGAEAGATRSVYAVIHLAYTEVFRGSGRKPPRSAAEDVDLAGADAAEPAGVDAAEPAGVDAAEPASREPGAPLAELRALRLDAADADVIGADGGRGAPGVARDSARDDSAGGPAARGDAAPTGEPSGAAGAIGGAAEPVAPLPDGPLLALGPALPPLQPTTAGPGMRPFTSATELREALLDLVVARANRGIAAAWNSGALSPEDLEQWPHERLVAALCGQPNEFAPEHLADVDATLAELSAIHVRRLHATVVSGRRLPYLELSREFALDSLSGAILMIVAGPMLRGQIAKLYQILTTVTHRAPRALCDVHLVEQLLAGRDWSRRRQIRAALASDGPLVGTGLIERTGQSHLGDAGADALQADVAVLARLTGERGPIPLRTETCSLAALSMPAARKRALVAELSASTPPDRPLRLVLRGRRGSGRRTLAAALCARIGRPLALVDCVRIGDDDAESAKNLLQALRRARISGGVPCVSGLEIFSADGARAGAHVRSVLRAHRGAVIIRAAVADALPLDPGYVECVLPRLSEGERVDFWRKCLMRHQVRIDGLSDVRRGQPAAAAGATAGASDPAIDDDDIAALAARFRVGPGSIESAAKAVLAQRPDQPDEDRASGGLADALDQALRQHIEVRMGRVARRVTRLARWEQLALSDELSASVRELIGRVRARRRVFEHWGFSRTVTSARGLTALFHGPPGVGKTMVAGVIARELGLDLYRVDLAQVTSRWIGETEKNLSEVFDAAEDGQVVLLFDEADSLFSKRTEVKSSVDRHANQQVNYLLQRLDSFEGVAILTTNQASGIDKAFKRRMSMRLWFPFPDEATRAQLWAAHIPDDISTAGDIDVGFLAERFTISGGYIRNAALRAAFLAAEAGERLSQAHLIRALELEYREMGKLTPGGRLE